MRDYKLIVNEKWRDFEMLAFIAIKAELKDYNVIKETLTEAIKDGGYDGEYILSVKDNVLQVLFEAKLRSSISTDLELGQFAKSLVIAVTRFADVIYIVTNLHFSQYTIEQLSKFAYCSGIDIKLYNGYSIKQFIEKNTELLESIDCELLDFLLNANGVSSEQTINRSHIFPQSDITFNTEEEHEFSKIKKFFNMNQKIFYITGEPYVGKTFFIERLVLYLRQSYINVQVIDVSKCSSYIDFFVELFEKTFGIFFDLIDILDEENFEEAFQKIGINDISARDIHILKVIFSKENIPEYDYAVIFHFICQFYTKLLSNKKEKNKFIIAFLNISQADSKIIKLLIYILSNCKKICCILEISENEYRLDDNEFWEREAKNQLLDLSYCSFNKFKLKELCLEESIGILHEKYPIFNKTQCKNILNKFGFFKRELYDLIELIRVLEVFADCPSELVCNEIIAWETLEKDSTIIKCLEYMQYKNSYMTYIYTFLNCLNGKVTFEFLEGYPFLRNELEECYSVLRNTNLFYVSTQHVYTKTQKVLDCLKNYCEQKISYTLKNNVAKYIYDNICSLHLSSELFLETQINCLVYIDPYKRIKKLLELGNLYLLLEQNAIAGKKFDIVLNYAEEENIELISEEKIGLYIGLVKTSIWNTEKKRNDIEFWLSEIDNIFSENITISHDILMYKLDYFLLGYQLYHSLGITDFALDYSKRGTELIEKENLYKYDIEKCGKMWRFHAIAIKEERQNLKLGMDIFYKAKEKCQKSAKFIFGYVIHENMTFDDTNYELRLNKKLKNYQLLENIKDKLSIDEFLHYKTNIAAIHFYLKNYDIAYNIYSNILNKSITFGIKRETMRILNDMANIDWIRGNFNLAEQKYCRAIKIAEDAGYYQNCWPVSLNYLSYCIHMKNFKQAYELYKNLRKYNVFILRKNNGNINNFEERETYNTALIIEIDCLCKLYNQFKYSDLKNYIYEIDGENQVRHEKEKLISEHLLSDLKKTMYEHYTITGEKLYLLKN